MVVVLMGVSGAGKTAVGKLLARQLGWTFLEGDDYHPAANIDKMRRGVPLTSSPLLVDDELYLVSDIGIASCVDRRSGKTYWQQRLGGDYSASPVFADGRIYFLSEDGVATVIAPGREFHGLAKNELDGTTLASMAVSQGSIFIRSDRHLYRIGAR